MLSIVYAIKVAGDEAVFKGRTSAVYLGHPSRRSNDRN